MRLLGNRWPTVAVAVLATTAIATSGCAGSARPSDLATATAFPTAAGGELVSIGVLGPLTQSEVDTVRAKCGRLPTVVDVVAGPQQIVIRSSSLSPIYVGRIKSCVSRLPFVRFVD